MPDILSPNLDIETPSFDVADSSLNIPKWDRPQVNIPDILKEGKAIASQFPGKELGPSDFKGIVDQALTPAKTNEDLERQKMMNSFMPSMPISSDTGMHFRTFNSRDAFRYKQDKDMWKNIGYNPELPQDVLDAQYDHNESTWSSAANVFKKMWATTSFQFKNYFQEYADTAEAISKVDMSLLSNAQRFKDYSQELKDLEDTNPDYKTDKDVRWWQLQRGDFWEESGSSLGFTIGTIGAALLENVAITAATAGLGEVAEIYNTPRKMFKAISDYYSLKRAYGLVKGIAGAKSVGKWIGNAGNIWRLTNGALAEAAFEGANASNDYVESFRQEYINTHGIAPSEDIMRNVRDAGDRIAKATTLFQTPFLMASNAAQFGNIIAPKTLGKILEKPAYRLAMRDGFKVGVEATEKAITNPFLKRGSNILGAVKNSAWEGTEESYQALVSKSTTDYYKKNIDGTSNRDILKSLGTGFDYITSNEGLKEFMAGFATGAIFKIAGKPFQYINKPKETTNAETGDKEFKFNFLNKMGVGSAKANKVLEKQHYENMAKKLNATDVDAVFREEGLFNLLKDKKTALALAKFVDTNDFFNMENAKNLQLNRMLYAGLATGKIDLQLSKLNQFAAQDFNTLKDFFDLDENEYSTPDEQQAFLDNLQSFTASLSDKAKEFEQIYEVEKKNHEKILNDASAFDTHYKNKYNSTLRKMQDKYKVNSEEELSNIVLSAEDKIELESDRAYSVLGRIKLYSVQEGLKASVFAMAGMSDEAKRARKVVDQLNNNNILLVNHEREFTNLFDRDQRDNTIKELEDMVKFVADEDKPNAQKRLDAFNKVADRLNKNFDEAEEIDEEKLADELADYFETISKLDNPNQSVHRFHQQRFGETRRYRDLLRDYLQIQKNTQENLNLYNFLASAENREDYANSQSATLADFFSDAMDLRDQEDSKNLKADAVNVAPTPSPVTTPTAAPVVQVITPTTPTVTTPTVAPIAPVAPASVPLTAKSANEVVTALFKAVKANDLVAADEAVALGKTFPVDEILEKRDVWVKRSNDAETFDNYIRQIVGDAAFDAHLNPTSAPVEEVTEPAEAEVTEPTVEAPVVELPIETEPESAPEVGPVQPEETETPEPVVPPADDSLEAKKADIEKRRQEELAKAIRPNAPQGNYWGQEKDINDKYDAELAALEQSEAPVDNRTEAEKIADEFIEQALKDNIVPKAHTAMAKMDALGYLKFVAEQSNNIVGDQFDLTNDSRPGVYNTVPTSIIDKANELFPGYKDIATTAEQNRILEPVASDDVPPTQSTGNRMVGTVRSDTPDNIVSILIDRARKDGNFIFDTVNPKEIEKVEDNLITLKSDPKMLRQRKVIDHLTEVMNNDENDEEIAKYKFKLEFPTPENVDHYFQRDEKASGLVAFLVDENGKKILFDKDGKRTETGYPFGMEFENKFYQTDSLNTSRHTLGGNVMPSIDHGFYNNSKRDTKNNAPLSTIYSLLTSNIPVYGSVLGVLGGRLSTANVDNTYNAKSQSSYKMRNIDEMIADGDIDPQFIDIKINGYYLDNPGGVWTSGPVLDQDTQQRVKIGTPYLYDPQSKLYIPLTGKKLRDITFRGNKIPKGSQLYEIIDTLDKMGSISVDTTRPDKTRILQSRDEIKEVFYFLREILYSKAFGIALSSDGTTIHLNRNVENLKANSVWDSPINFVSNKNNASVKIPLTDSSSTEDEMGYPDFLNENFMSGAVKAQISKGETSFTKLNKRIMFQLDKSHEQMVQDLTKGQLSNNNTSAQVGDRYHTVSNPSEIFQVTEVDEDFATLTDGENEKRVKIEGLANKWVKLQKELESVSNFTTEQQSTIDKITPLVKQKGVPRERSTYTVTRIIRPNKTGSSTSSVNVSTVLGTVIDDIAKNIFIGNKVSSDDKITINNIKGTIGSYFKSELHYKEVVDKIKSVKDQLDNEGYTYLTDVIVSDKSADISGEIDLLLIDKEGKVRVADFKTSRQSFDDSHLASDWGTGVTERQYFASQGYLYGLMLAKQTDVEVSDDNRILGFPLNYEEDPNNIYNSKIVNIREKATHVFKFNKSEIAEHFKKSGLPLTSAKDIVNSYNEVRNKNATTPNSPGKTVKGKKGTEPLEMSIDDIKRVASTREELQKAVDDMSRMMGEDFVVTYVNAMNAYRFGEFNVDGVTLYRNATTDTVYHEGWHKFSQLFLTRRQKENLYDSLRSDAIKYTDRRGNKRSTSRDTDIDIEEFLADEWVKYTNSPKAYNFPSNDQKGIIGFFRKLWKFIKEWFSGTRPIDLFNDLYNGRMANYTKDVNNAMWGKLASAVVNNNGNEVVGSARASLYVSTTSFLIGKILREKNLSFSWLRENIRSNKIKNYLWNEYIDIIDNLSKTLDIPENIGDEFVGTYILGNIPEIVERTVRTKNANPDNIYRTINQIEEINNILDDENGGFDNFYNFYTRNSDIDSIRESSSKLTDLSNALDSTAVDEIISEYSQETAENDEEKSGELSGDDDDAPNSKGSEYGKGPNDEAPFQKASKEVQDFFRTMPIVMGLDSQGEPIYALNELGVPETYEYSSIFNKTKTLLGGAFTIESVFDVLNRPYVQKSFPQAKFIHDQLKGYYDNPKAPNFAFIQKFLKVMYLPEIDNKKVTINYDALAAGQEDRGMTAIRMRSMSRVGETQEIQQWKFAFNIPSGIRTGTPISEIKFDKVFDDTSETNILYNIEGRIFLNPFFNFQTLEKMDSKRFLSLMGINLNEGFWEDTLSGHFSERVKSLILRDLSIYREYANYLLTLEGVSQDSFRAIAPLFENDEDMIAFHAFFKKIFIENPLQQFAERRTYRIKDDNSRVVDTWSITPALEDLSRRNSIYSRDSSSRSFTDGGGKMKYPFYELSVMAYRSNLLNRIEHTRDFNNNIELSFINPNKQPWLKQSFFYQKMFDDRGNRRSISHDVINNDTEITQQKVKIEVADLSSFETIQDRRYNIIHPRNLSAQDKLYFDTITMFTNGLLEIPRAATSSTTMAIKLNSYDAKRMGRSAVTQFLPVDLNEIIISSSAEGLKVSFLKDKVFHTVMRNYLTADLLKMKWYHDNANITREDLNDPKSLANRLNVFDDILPQELKDKLISDSKSSKSEDIQTIVSDNKESIDSAVAKYFTNYIKSLYNGTGPSSFMKMSPNQKSILGTLLNVYSNQALSNSAEDVSRETRIASINEETGERSAHQSSIEKKLERQNGSLQKLAAGFAVNQFILNVEYHTWFMGDNYLFENPFKRGNLTTNTGTFGIVSDFTNRMLNEQRGETLHSLYTGKNETKDFRKLKTYVVKEVKTKSRHFDMMIDNMITFELQYGKLTTPGVATRREELAHLMQPYSKMKSADGQSKITLDAYRTLRKIYGNWDNQTDEKEYQRQIAITRLHNNSLYRLSGDALDEAVTRDSKFVKEGPYSTFNPQKFAYTGPELLTDSNGNHIDSPLRTKFDKTSLHPLIPEALLGSGLADEKLMIEMAIADADYVKMESAAKGVKHSGLSEFFDNFGNATDAKLEDANPEWLLSSYLKHQLSTDGVKDENTLGSQQRVSFFDVKYIPEVQDNPSELRKIEGYERAYLDSIANIMQFQRYQFLNRFGLEEFGQGQSYELKITDEGRFANAINSIAKSNNFPSNMMDYLQYNPSTQEYKYDPSLVFNRKMLLDTIGGIIDAELRRVKTKGTAAIQVTSVGQTKQPYTNPTEDQIKQFGTNGLHYYHYKFNDDGTINKTSTMGIKLTLQGDFKNLLRLEFQGKPINTLTRLNQALKNPEFRQEHLSKLTFVGYRIPTSNNNFIDHVEVMEFLPESAGNIIIAPMEHIVKSGSDFDVDKLNFIFPSIDRDGDLTATQLTKKQKKTSFDKNKGENVTTTETVQDNLPPIEEIYNRLNEITSSVKDYKFVQQQAKGMIKTGVKDLKPVIETRDRVEVLIRETLFNLDDANYMSRVNNGDNLQEILRYFQPFLVDNEELAHHISNLYDLNEVIEKNKSRTSVVTEEGEIKIDPEFEKLFSQLSRYKDSYTNEMIKSMKLTLEHPAYLKMMITPSNADYLLGNEDGKTDEEREGQAGRIGRLTGRSLMENATSTQNMTYTVVNNRHKEYLADSKDLGLYAIQRRWYSLLNYSKMELNRDWQYKTASVNYNMKIYSPLIKPEDRPTIGRDSVQLYGDNIDGISPRDLWDQMMTATIDLPTNSKYVLFGINKHNRKIAQYLMISRHSMTDILAFINQPVLQEIYEEYEVQSKKMPNYTLKTAMLDKAKSYGIKGEKMNKLYALNYDIDKDDNVTGANVFVQNPGPFANELLTEEDYFDRAQMEADLEWFRDNKGKTKDAEFKERQKRILLYFMTVNLEASNFTAMQFAYSEDRNKNTNYFTITENDNKKQDIRGDLENNLPVSGSMFNKDALVKLEKNSIYSNFVYGGIAKMFYEEFAEKFTRPRVAKAFIDLLNMTNTFGIDKQILANRIEGDFVEFVYKNFAEFNMNIYDPFSDTFSPAEKKYGMFFMQNIFNIEQDPQFRTYQAKLVKFLERYPELKSVPTVSRMYTEGLSSKSEDRENANPMDNYAANVVRFNRSQDNTIAERNFYVKELENLINFKPEEFRLGNNYTEDDKAKISAFFTELSYLTLYQAGPTNIADNFSDLLPATMWQSFSSKAFENYKKAIDGAKINEGDLMKLFSMMYIHNNPKVPWKDNRTFYDIKYFGENIRSGQFKDSDRKNAYKTRENTKYFLNFRAGKMYDINQFADMVKFKKIQDLNC